MDTHSLSKDSKAWKSRPSRDVLINAFHVLVLFVVAVNYFKTKLQLVEF